MKNSRDKRTPRRKDKSKDAAAKKAAQTMTASELFDTLSDSYTVADSETTDAATIDEELWIGKRDEIKK